MGYNPIKEKVAPPIPKQTINVALFHDLYHAFEKEYGEEYVKKHIATCALFLDDSGRGTIECDGMYPTMKILASLLVMRLAVIKAETIYHKTEGKEVLGLKETARTILEDMWKRIASLEDFSHTFTKKP